MSKTGAWVLAMQEDASEMSLEEFCSEWGHSHSEVWEEVQEEAEGYVGKTSKREETDGGWWWW